MKASDRPDADLAAHLDAALSLHQAGRLDDAQRGYETILAADPDHPAALLSLGSVLMQQGRPHDATDLFRRAVAVSPTSAEAHADLAASLHATGQTGESLACYRTALSLDAGRAETHFGIAALLQSLTRHEEAAGSFRTALSLDSDYAEAALGLGISLHAMNRPAEAVAHYRVALAVDPAFHEAAFQLGRALQDLDRHEAAAACFRRIIAAVPDHAEALSQLGVSLQTLDRHDDALPLHAQAVALAPNAERMTRYGTALLEAGRIEAAHRWFERAIAQDPDYLQAFVSLFGSRQVEPDDPALQLAERMLTDGRARPPRQLASLHLALGKARQKLGHDRRAFEHFLQGNALTFATEGYDERATLAGFGRIASVFDAAFLSGRAGGGDPSPLPIFIIGMPRSGSTLIEQILASHPNVAALGERPYLGEALAAAGGMTSGREGAPSFPESVPGFTPDDIRGIAQRYLARLRQGIPPARASRVERVTDKLLGNFTLVGLIRIALPGARIIHIRRDPIDTCLSCFTTGLPEIHYARDLGTLGRYYAAYARLMAHWRTVLPPGAMLELRYEDIVNGLEIEARRVLAHCGLAWHPDCLSFHKTVRPVRTASMSQVRQPLYRSSVGRWDLDEAVLQPLLDGLGSQA